MVDCQFCFWKHTLRERATDIFANLLECFGIQRGQLFFDEHKIFSLSLVKYNIFYPPFFNIAVRVEASFAIFFVLMQVDNERCFVLLSDLFMDLMKGFLYFVRHKTHQGYCVQIHHTCYLDLPPVDD
jgi:hypothetical protein